MSKNYFNQPKRKSRSSVGSSSDKHSSHQALSISPKTSRRPAIQMVDATDVATLSCVELSRAIMMRPEVNTGSLFKLIAASNSETNKSDAVLVITAAVLYSIGNNRAADDILNKSKSVSVFYERMRLDDDNMRNSFVIMLFALAPEFVKMIESCVQISVKRVAEFTEAPYAESKLFKAATMLKESSSVTESEYNTILEDTTKLKLVEARDRGSLQLTPTEMVSADDSASQIGSRFRGRLNSNITTESLMEHVKAKRMNPNADFYERFPDASRPLSASVRPPRMGLGFKSTPSEVTAVKTESDLTLALDGLLGDKTRIIRPKVPNDKMSMFRRPEVKSETSSESTEIGFKGRRKDSVMIDPMEYLVTADDITKSSAVKVNEPEGFSYTNTQVSKSVMDLLNLI